MLTAVANKKNGFERGPNHPVEIWIRDKCKCPAFKKIHLGVLGSLVKLILGERNQLDEGQASIGSPGRSRLQRQ